MDVCGKILVNLRNVKWIFFDMGWVLVDSRYLFSFMAERLYQKLHVEAEFLKELIVNHFVRLKFEKGFKTVRRLFYDSFLKSLEAFVWKTLYRCK